MLRYKDFLEFIAAVNNGDVVLPGLELPMDRILLTQDYRKELANMPMSHLALQMYTVRDTGTSVVKGDKYTDDMFRCLVLAYKLAFSSKTKSHLNKSKIKRLDKKTNNKQGRILVSGRSLLSMRTRLD
jgi:hypothetical protein